MKQILQRTFFNGFAQLKEPNDSASQLRLKYILAGVIVLVTGVKLGLIGRGFLSNPDEFRYWASRNVLEKLSEFRIKTALNAIFSTQGRPGDAVIKVIPNALQFITAHLFHCDYYDSKNAFPLFLFNFITYCLTLIVLFKFARLLLKDVFLALMSVLAYSALTNSYAYLRHTFPYDQSLLILYYVLYVISKNTAANNYTFRSSFFIGFLSFFGYLVYPGYIPLYLTGLFLLFFTNLSGATFLKNFFRSFYYGAGSICCLILFEAMARIGGTSYIGDALLLSKTITLGEFEETLTFIVKYLYEAEGITGIILLIGLGAFFFTMAYHIWNKTIKAHMPLLLLFIPLAGLFLAYGFAGYFFHKTVFYARLLHQYFPTICICAVFALNELFSRLKNNRQLAFAAIGIALVAGFGFNFYKQTQLYFPRDISWSLIKSYKAQNIDRICEYDSNYTAMPIEKEILNSSRQIHIADSTKKCIIVNDCMIYHAYEFSGLHEFRPPPEYTLIMEKNYYLNSKVYQFEGFTSMERENLDRSNLQVKVYAK